MRPPFSTDFEYDVWFEKKQADNILDDYYGEGFEDGKVLEL